jgi:hypothetical protein
MLQIILLLAVAGVAAYFIISSRKSKVRDHIKETSSPVTPIFDPVVPAPVVEEVPVKVEDVVATEEQKVQLKEVKKKLVKKAPAKKDAVVKKTTKKTK